MRIFITSSSISLSHPHWLSLSLFQCTISFLKDKFDQNCTTILLNYLIKSYNALIIYTVKAGQVCASGRLAAGGRIFITFRYFRCCFRLGRFGSNASLTLKKPIEVWPSRRTRRVFGRRRGTAGTCLQKVAVATATAMRPDSMGPWLFLKVMCNQLQPCLFL